MVRFNSSEERFRGMPFAQSVVPVAPSKIKARFSIFSGKSSPYPPISLSRRPPSAGRFFVGQVLGPDQPGGAGQPQGIAHTIRNVSALR
jgi:hypothetical protein